MDVLKKWSNVDNSQWVLAKYFHVELVTKKLLTKVVKFQAEVLCLSKLITFWLDMGAAESTLPHFNRVKVRDVLRNLTPFVKFKKREKHPWRSDTFSKAPCWSLQLYKKLHSSLLVFSCILNCTKGTKSPKASHMLLRKSNLVNEITQKLSLQSTVAKAASWIDVYKFCKRLTRRSNAAF